MDCEGNLNCEIIGDDTVVATSEDNNTSINTSTTMLNQSDIIQSENDLDAIDEQELDSRIMGWLIDCSKGFLLDMQFRCDSLSLPKPALTISFFY